MSTLSMSERVPLRGWWRRLGWGGQFCSVLTMAIVLLAVMRMVGLDPGSSADGNLAEWAVLLLAGLIWAGGTAAASVLPVGGYLIAGLWLGWHGIALMGPWTGTPVVALPVMWWLAVGLAMLAWRRPGRKIVARLWWLMMALGAGYLLAGPGGWNRLPGMARDDFWVGRLGVGLGLGMAGWWIGPRLRGWAWTEPSFGRVLGGSLIVMATGLGLSVWRDAEAAAGWAWSMVEGVRCLALLGWFWLGGLFFVGLLAGLERGGGWMGRVAPTKVMGHYQQWAKGRGRWIMPGIWLTVTVLEWLTTHQTARPWAGKLLPGLLDGISAWPPGWRIVAEAHGWVGVVVIVLGVALRWQGDGGPQMMGRLNVVWLAAFPCLMAVAQALPMAAGMKVWGGMAWVGPGALLPGGAFCAALYSIREGRRPEAAPGAGLWGALMAVSGVLLAGQAGGLRDWGQGGGAAAFLGLLHLGVPLVLYRWWTQERGSGGDLPFSSQISLSVAGMLVVLPLLHRDVTTVSQMAVCPVLWLPVLLWIRMRQPALDTAAGTMAGGLLGSGTVAAWSRPDLLLPEIPLFGWLNPPSGIFAGMDVAGRPFFNPAHFTLLLLMGTFGALLGAIVFRAKPAPRLPLMPILADPAATLP